MKCGGCKDKQTINHQTGAPDQHLLDPPPQDYFNEAINVPDFFSPLYQCKIWTSVAIASPEQSDREDTSNGWNKQRHMIEIKDAFVGFKPSPLPPHPTGTTTGCLHNPRPFVPSQRPNSRGFNAD